MPTNGQPIYGTVIIAHHTDPGRGIFGMTVDQADPLILIDPEVLTQAASNSSADSIAIVGDLLVLRGLGGTVTYRLTGWENGKRIGERLDNPEAPIPLH